MHAQHHTCIYIYVSNDNIVHIATNIGTDTNYTETNMLLALVN